MSADGLLEATFRFPSGQTRLLMPSTAQADLMPHIAEIPGVDRCVLITDENAARLHSSRFRSDGELPMFVLPAGEASKNLDVVSRAYDWLAQVKADRRTAVIALGGGTVSDVAGFVAATWMRGVPWIACPTTLLAMIDACLGGKTGVNLGVGKNLIGAYHHPALIWADVSLLASLTPRDFAAGLAESVKHAVAVESAFVDWQELNLAAVNQRDPATVSKLVERNLRIKAAVVAADERERGGDEPARAALNFGHTVGHALEALSGFAWPHGECVALGMVAEMELAVLLRKMQVAQRERVKSLLTRYGLAVKAPARVDADAVLAQLSRDKKTLGGRTRLVIPDRLGRVVWHVVEDDAPLRVAIEAIQP